MRTRHAMTDTVELMGQTEADIAVAITGAMTDDTDQLKTEFRDQIEGAGLGRRLANTVRGKTYPSGRASLDPAGWVFTKAPDLVDAYDRGVTIAPNGHRYLWIPTSRVPRSGRRRMTPAQVEARFGQKLVVIRSKAGQLEAFIPVASNRAGRATRQRLILMFVLRPQVRVKKRLDVDGLAARAGDRFQGCLDRRWTAIPTRTARMGRLR